MWISVTLHADAERAEALSDALMDAGALSVSIEDADAGTDAEQPQFGEPGHLPTSLWDHSRVIALFDGDTGRPELEAALAEASHVAGLDAVPAFSTAEVAEQNWVQLTQSQFDPIRITDRLWIVPSWHQAPDARAINIELDPGMAFGTGSHPTTRLCLEWLAGMDLAGRQVLDFGCGSGILAIAALVLGARSATALDLDPQALRASRDNALRNGCDARLRVVDPAGLAAEARFGVVVANILADTLIALAPTLALHCQAGARVALSGILTGQANRVQEACAPWLDLHLAAELDGWALLSGAPLPRR